MKRRRRSRRTESARPSAAGAAARPAGPPGAARKPGRPPLLRRAARALDLPADIYSGMAHLELSGNRELVADGLRGVLEYDENVVRLNLGKFVVRVVGRGLTIRALTDDTAVVEGFILSVEFQDAVV